MNEFLNCLNSNLAEQQNIIKKIENKLHLKPHTEYLEIWIQRMLYKRNLNYSYQSALCKRVMGDSVQIWNYDWLDSTLLNKIKTIPIIDSKELKNMNSKISSLEVNQFEDRY